MTNGKAIQYKIDHKFDPERSRHYLNGFCTVLHCHHYATLYTQLADDATDFMGERLLKEAAEDTFYDVLNDYFNKNNIQSVDDKIETAQQYWQIVGMGIIRFTEIGNFSAAAEMDYSHLDEGWLKKWGSRDKPVNFISAGFVAAVTALINNKPSRSFAITETKGLVCGDEVSAFKAVQK